MPAPIRTVVIGYGFAGRAFHCYLLRLTPGLELVGVCSRNPDTRAKIAADLNVCPYATYEEVLADPAVDLVVLATPNASHAEQAIQALNAGKHVVTDKVMATTLADADRMFAAAEKNNRILTVFHNRRYDGDFLTLQHLLATDQLGQLTWLEMAWGSFPMWGGWRSSASSGGGKLLDLGAHLVDQLTVLFPECPTSVYARFHHDFPQHSAESQALLVITYPNNRTAVIDTSSLRAIPKPRFHAFGTKATFRKFGVDPQEKAMLQGNIDAAVESPDTYGFLHDGKNQTPVPTLPGRWRSFYENVRDVLTASAAPVITHSQLRRQIQILDAAFRSAAANQIISLYNVPPG